MFARFAMACVACTLLSAFQNATTGAITGTVHYGSEENPEMRICAVPVEDFTTCYEHRLERRGRKFLIENLPPGRYYVVAYLSAEAGADIRAGAWSRFAQCGATVNCKDRSLVAVAVVAGRTVSNVRIADWYTEGEVHQIDGFPPNCKEPVGQHEEVACNLLQFTKQDNLLNQEYKRVMGALKAYPQCQESLRRAQRSWIAFRDAHCAFETLASEKGTGIRCSVELTTERARYLQQLQPDECPLR